MSPRRSLSATGAHVWVISLDAPDLALQILQKVLSPAEHLRASRFYFARDQRHFVAARGALRCILAKYALVDPASLSFSYSALGKPSLAELDTDLRFNLSHSKDLALVAVTRQREIGIDIEEIRSEAETEKLARRFFSHRERDSLLALPLAERDVAFYRGWTCKEAVLKAWGTGLAATATNDSVPSLSSPLKDFDVELDPAKPAALLATRPDPALAALWCLKSVVVQPGFAAALATQGPTTEPVIYHWQHPTE